MSLSRDYLSLISFLFVVSNDWRFTYEFKYFLSFLSGFAPMSAPEMLPISVIERFETSFEVTPFLLFE
jgi:hypothetical protein